MWLISITLLFATLWLLRYFFKNHNSAKLTYWKKQGWPILEETISGWDVFTGKGNVSDSDVEYYKELERQKEPCGVVTELGTPIVVVRDLDLVKDIFIKDFDHFTDRRAFGDVDRIFKDGLFGLEGRPWKNMRTFLSPTFTSGRIRKMFCHFEKSANNLTKFIKSHHLSKNATHFDIPVVYTMRKFSMQVITSAAFGLKVDSFQDNDVVPMAERIFVFPIWQKIQMLISQQFPKLSSFLKLKIFDFEAADFFWGLISSALKTRKENGVKGNKILIIIAEVLRLYPSVARLDRICNNDYALPETKNGGKRRIIRKGTVIAVPADAFHKDEQYFPNPFKFDPTRFNQENKAKRNPYAYMPFGIGPRSCIGMRFAIVETKVALAYIVRNFTIRPTAGTPIPEKMEKDILGYKVASNVNLQFVPRK
ncbi:Cytochrome P450 3A13 [Folsomia candida]|uniref:Cytochrome P450 3A13 n=1 Tax=Folsomia candida TaxID=158441 RepID=A0A226DJ41_FOLCA|nr:Cytochrome P450 3A13 [Folsomia candida]